MTLVLLVLLSCVLRQVDTNSKNVFGQPRLRASLRDLRSPRRTYKSTIEDDLKKLIIMDNPGESPQRDPVRNTPTFPHHHQSFEQQPKWNELTLISVAYLPRSPPDELCSAPFLMSHCAAGAERPASPTLRTKRPPLTSCSPPRCPHADTQPRPTRFSPRRVSLVTIFPQLISFWALGSPTACSYTCLMQRGLLLTAAFIPSVPLSASELSLTEVRDKVPPLRRVDPGLMPLPDTACGLEWSSLVNAAKAYEGKEGNSTQCAIL